MSGCQDPATQGQRPSGGTGKVSINAGFPKGSMEKVSLVGTFPHSGRRRNPGFPLHFVLYPNLNLMIFLMSLFKRTCQIAVLVTLSYDSRTGQ